jgi:hypothetical protein
MATLIGNSVEQINIAGAMMIEAQSILEAHSGTTTFKQVLEEIRTPIALIQLIGRYISFNAPFGGGVSSLAGQIAERRDLFRDGREPVQATADRSVEVASNIFYAAVVEFGGQSKSTRVTHRSLAQALLKAVGEFFGYRDMALDEITRPNHTTIAAVQKVGYEYGLNQVLNDRKLFRALGFHMGSEMLADEEFITLDRFLRAEYADLVAYLRKTRVESGGIKAGAYHWVNIHTTVEADHYDAATVGVKQALGYYSGPESKEVVRGWVLEGFTRFVQVQAEFMEGLKEN